MDIPKGVSQIAAVYWQRFLYALYTKLLPYI